MFLPHDFWVYMAPVWKVGLIEKTSSMTVYWKSEDRLLGITVAIPQEEAQTCYAEQVVVSDVSIGKTSHWASFRIRLLQ